MVKAATDFHNNANKGNEAQFGLTFKIRFNIPCFANHLKKMEMRPQCSAFKATQHKAALIANETLGIKRLFLGNSGGGGQGNGKRNV